MQGLEVSEALAKVRPTVKTTIIVGTGLSLALTHGKYPQLSWNGLIEHGLKYAYELNFLDKQTQERWLSVLNTAQGVDETLSVAGILSKKLQGPGHVDYSRWLHHAFADTKIHDENLKEVIKSISDAGVRFCTLNYDSLLEEATGLPSICISDVDDVIDWLKGDKKAILHLHGHWKKPQSCVLSDSDYVKIIGNKSRDFFQQNLVVLQDLLYVGCGGTFEDPNFQNILKWLDTELQSARVPGFALVKNQEVLSRRAEWRGLVQPIGYGDERSNLSGFLATFFGDVVSSSGNATVELENKPSIRLIEEGVKKLSLDLIRAVLAPTPQALSVRHALSYQAGQLLKANRHLWLAADWGMCEDEFIWALAFQGSGSAKNLFEINIGNCKSGDSVVRQIEYLFGSSLESVLSAFSKAGDSYLIFRDSSLEESDNRDGLYQELINLAEIFTSVCESLKIIFVSRQSPSIKNFVVELTALDAADTRAYIENHPLYQGGLDRDGLYQIYELSHGVPRVITQYVEKLAVASLDEIVVEGGATDFNLEGKLGDSIISLETSEDLKLKSSFLLLKHLAAFPYGEFLENIKRINKRNKFTTDHVLVLQQLGFIYVEIQDRIGQAKSKSPKKRLVVTRGVRQWLQQKQKRNEIAKIAAAVYQLYFGEGWESNNFKLDLIFKSIDMGENSSEVNNAKTFIVDLFAHSAGNARKRSVVIGLTANFFAAMTKRNYFKAVHDLYASLKPWFNSDESGENYWYLDFLHAKALRMSGVDGAPQEALEILLRCLDHITDRKTLASAKISIALIYSSLGDEDNALSFARQVQKTSRGATELQAAHIILKHSDSPNKPQQLLELEAKAKKTKAAVTYVNIALTRIRSAPDGESKIEELERQVGYCVAEKNAYGHARALLDLAEARLKVKERLDPRMISALIGIYHHLHNDDLTSLHAQCHKILWSVFVQNNDILNLLQLFKYSSIFWRLRDKPELELHAIKKLRNIAGSTSLSGCENESALSYYYGRTNILPSLR